MSELSEVHQLGENECFVQSWCDVLREMDPTGAKVKALQRRVNQALAGQPLLLAVVAMACQMTDAMAAIPEPVRMAASVDVLETIQECVRDSLN